MNFGYKVQKLREEADIPLKTFANKIWTSPEVIWECENKNRIPRPEVIVRIAEFFDVNVEDLFKD
jgi:DNA-binding XRE family transcriptional regulator